MIRRLLLAACLGACSLPAQLGLFVIQGGHEAPITGGQFGFGTVSVGDVTDIPFRLRNGGVGPTPLTVLTLAGQDFSFVNPPAIPQTVPAGAAVDFTVRYAPTQPSSSANFSADGVSAIFFGRALSAASISMDDGSGTLQPLGADAVIEFGTVVRDLTVTRRIVLANPSSSEKLSIRNVVVLGAAFHLERGPLPIVLGPAASATMQLDFNPASNGKQLGTLEIEQRSFLLTGLGVDPAAPIPSITLDIAKPVSAEQGTLTVRLGSVSRATTTGEVHIDVQPSTATPNTDNGIVFLATNSRTATFNVNEGDTVGHFGSQPSVQFQTGTTAGNIVFTVKLEDFTDTKTLGIAPAVAGFDLTKAQRTSGGLDLRVNAFDNTRSASKITFTFFDRSGTALLPGAMTLDNTAAFQQFFAASDLGGLFALQAFFPVNGNPAQVDSVEVKIVNSAGTAKTEKVLFTP
jgi:hypothetical protein